MKNKIKNLINFRKKISNKKLTIGSWMQISNTTIAEIMADSNFEWIVVDLEHGIFNISDLPDIFRAIESKDCIPFARLGSNTRSEIQSVLESGCCGIIYPNILNSDQLEGLISYAKWPPAGKRGVGYSRANLHGKYFNEYKVLSKNIISIAMIEDVEAINNLDSILSVKELDAIFIGPYDLSASLGIVGQFDNKIFKSAIKEILLKSIDYNVSCGIHVVEPSLKKLKDFSKKGYSFIAYSLDAVLIKNSLL